MNDLSEVEQYWNRIREHEGIKASWHQMYPQSQVALIQSINLLLSVIQQEKHLQALREAQG